MPRKKQESRQPGPRRTTKQTYSKQPDNGLNNLDTTFISMVFITILLFVIVYGKSGELSKVIDPIIGGIFGPIKVILPICSAIMCIILASENRRTHMTRIMQYSGLVALFSSIFSIMDMANGTLKIQAFTKMIENAYILGTKNKGGGVIGAIIASPLAGLLGVGGAIAVILAIVITVLIIMFKISPTQYLSGALEDIKESKKEKDRIREMRLREEHSNFVYHSEKNLRQTKLEEMNQKQEEFMDDEELEVKYIPKKPGFFSSLISQRGSKIYDVEKDGGVGGQRKLHNSSNKQELNENLRTSSNIEENSNEINNKNSGLKQGQMPPEFQVRGNLEKEDETVKQIGQAVFTTEMEKKQEPKVKEVMNLNSEDIKYEDYEYIYPPIDLLNDGPGFSATASKQMIEDTANKLQKTLYSFGVSAKVMDVSVGPAITRYELKPAVGVKVSKISNLVDDIALNLAAETIRIEAPIPGKQAVGIEVPNEQRQMVVLKDLIASKEFESTQSKVSFALGKDVGGEIVVADIFKMPHLLVAGSTGSGKSVCVNTIITSILYKSDPNEVKFIMVDPKVVELSMYNSIPHLLIPVITEPMKAAAALRWAVQEMIKRYNKFAEHRVKDLDSFNSGKSKEERMPKIIILIDELADLMMVAAKEVEDSICRIAQMGRAAGMHLVIATQRPSVDVITGLIKANVPSRIAFAVSSGTDSRTILDSVGAEKLLGKGDMLYYPAGETKPKRVQGAFVSEKEIVKVVDFVKRKEDSEASNIIEKEIQSTMAGGIDDSDSAKSDTDGKDPILMEAIEEAVKSKKASISLLRRRFRIGDSRAGRIIDDMERMGIVSAQDGNKPREVLISEYQWAQIKEQGNQSEDSINVVEEKEEVSFTQTPVEQRHFDENAQRNLKQTTIEEANNNLQNSYNGENNITSNSSNSFEEDFINDNEDSISFSNNNYNNENINHVDFSISKGTLNVTESLVEEIIDFTTNEPYFMDTIEDMIEDDEISTHYLKRNYRISEQRAEDIMYKLRDMNMISMSTIDTAVVTITRKEWDKINELFIKLTDEDSY